MIGVSRLGHIQRPGGVARRVARREVGRQGRGAESHPVAIVQDTVYLCGRKMRGGISAVKKVAAPTRFYGGYVRGHHRNLGMGQAFEFSQAPNVVEMGLAVEQDFNVLQREAQRFHVLTDLRGGGGQIAVEQEVAARRGNQVRR